MPEFSSKVIQKDTLMTMATAEFTTERLFEEKVIIWKFKNFTHLQESKRPNDTTSLTFPAGETLQRSSTWKLKLRFINENEIGLHLYLEKSYKFRKGVLAQYTASIRGPGSKVIESCFSSTKKYYTLGNGWGWDKFVTLEELKTDGALINGNLAIHVKITIYGKEVIRNDTIFDPEILHHTSLNEMSKYFEVLLETGEGSDFVIRVKKLDSQEYFEMKVHRAILSAKSPVFKTMLESEMSEKATGVVTITDLTPTGLNVLLKFIYTGNLPKNWKLVPEEVINAAEKYNFPLMKKFCSRGLHTACTPENAFTLLKLANTYGLSEASKNISKFIKSNFKNVLSKV